MRLLSHVILLSLFLGAASFGASTEVTKPEILNKAVEGDEDDTLPGDSKPKVDAAEGKFWRAIKLLESKLPDEVVIGRRILQEASDEEFTHAQILLGNCHLSASYGFPRDFRKAANLFRLAAERGNAFAKVSLGTCYATGNGVKKDDAKAAEWLNAALAPNADFSQPNPPPDFNKNSDRRGSEVAGELAQDQVGSSKATAHFLLAQIYTRLKKTGEAQSHYVEAATAGPDGRSGIYQAAIEAAVYYAFGKGIPRDPAKASELLDQSRRLNARMGVSLIHNYVSLKIVDEFAVADLEEQITEAGSGYQSTVQFQIAQSLADKKSKDYNPAEAARWYELAGENGQAWAMLSLGLMHARGELGAVDLKKAFYWFEKAGSGEKPKHILGVANLAICLEQGLGTDKDVARANEIFKKYRNYDIICYLGTLHQAPAKPVDYDEALKLNQIWAKDKKDPHAQYLLGMRYFNGDGVKASASDCQSWLKKAASAKHGDALCQLGWLYQSRPWQDNFSDLETAMRAATEAYKAAGEAGSIEGMANYANALSAGSGVKKTKLKRSRSTRPVFASIRIIRAPTIIWPAFITKNCASRTPVMFHSAQ